MVNDHVLVLCTANMCRSPMAAAMLRAHLDPGVTVSSAGFMGAGRQVPPEVLEVMARRGLDLSNHLSSNVEQAVEPPPDLVLTMSRQHIRSLSEVDQQLLPKSFTLKEFVRRSEAAEPRRAGESLSRYAQRLSMGRDLRKLASGREDDVQDPMGKRKSAYEKCAKELDMLTAGVVAALAR